MVFLVSSPACFYSENTGCNREGCLVRSLYCLWSTGSETSRQKCVWMGQSVQISPVWAVKILLSQSDDIENKHCLMLLTGLIVCVWWLGSSLTLTEGGRVINNRMKVKDIYQLKLGFRKGDLAGWCVRALKKVLWTNTGGQRQGSDREGGNCTRQNQIYL